MLWWWWAGEKMAGGRENGENYIIYRWKSHFWVIN